MEELLKEIFKKQYEAGAQSKICKPELKEHFITRHNAFREAYFLVIDFEQKKLN